MRLSGLHRFAWAVALGWVFSIGTAPADPQPNVEPRVLAALAAHCDTLLALQQPTGIFRDEQACWWTAGIATRALLGAHAALGDERYLRGARLAVDAFVKEQRYDGGWFTVAYQNVTSRPRDSRNIADLGCMTVCLPLMSMQKGDEDRDAQELGPYLAAHRHYLDFYLPRHDLHGGAFCNGWFQGSFGEFPYSIATATQAVALAAHYQATGESAYLRRAEEAARFLVNTLREDGRFTLYPHDRQRTLPLPATEFHQGYYLIEALLWVYHCTDRAELRDSIAAALLNHMWGEEGLLEQIRDAGWIRSAAEPDREKAFGMVGVLDGIDRILGSAIDLGPYVREGARELAEGIALQDPERSLAGVAFAALSLAQLSAPTANVMGERP